MQRDNSGRAGVPRCGVLSLPPTPRSRAGSKPKIFPFPNSFTNSVTKSKMRTLHYAKSSKPHIRLKFTTNEASSGKSSPQTLSSLLFSSAGSTSRASSSSSQNSTIEHKTHRPLRASAPRLRIASLLAETRSRSYQLNVVQNPVRTAEFRSATLSRLPLSPPTVVQLTVRDSSGNSIVPDEEIPFLIAYLSLYAENGTTILDMGSSMDLRLGAPPPILYGNLVSSLQHLEDHNGNRGMYFIFPDVSIRWRGRYQLGIHLVKISRPDSSGLAEEASALAQAQTNTFDVVPYHEYTVPPQTRLTQTFLRQGARMR
ncbi:velvet factor-domain-containing protein [Mycena amicta]|nr:velvet factor-domain-containing protein [Mycena amicta]